MWKNGYCRLGKIDGEEIDIYVRCGERSIDVQARAEKRGIDVEVRGGERGIDVFLNE